MLIKNLIICALLAFIIIGCSAVPVENRFKRTEESVKPKEEVTNTVVKEDFDFTPYKTKIEFGTHYDVLTSLPGINLWTNYSDDKNIFSKITLTKTPGFRVQVLTTDNFDEADSLRSELYFKTNNKNIYICKEASAYKIRIGDFPEINSAKELNFKLTQIGYSNSIVVPDSINIYK